jgi:hypothetical protein
MKQFYTIYCKDEPIAIIRGEHQKNNLLKISSDYLYKPTKNFSEIKENWFEIFQKENLIGYFSKLKYASSSLIGEFYADRIRE